MFEERFSNRIYQMFPDQDDNLNAPNNLRESIPIITNQEKNSVYGTKSG